MRVISGSTEKRERYHVGDDIGLIWGKYLDVKGNFRKTPICGYLNFSADDPFIGKTSVELLDHLYSEFIRIYWDFPPAN